MTDYAALVAELRRYIKPTFVGDAQERAADAIEALAHERDGAVALLCEARDDIESWATYATGYFQEKYDLAGDLARYDAFLARIKETEA
jgi:hypothetical protein